MPPPAAAVRLWQQPLVWRSEQPATLRAGVLAKLAGCVGGGHMRQHDAAPASIARTEAQGEW